MVQCDALAVNERCVSTAPIPVENAGFSVYKTAGCLSAWKKQKPTGALSVKTCPRCHTETPLETKFCPNCGSAMPAETKAANGDPMLGRIIADKFRVESKIGAGAMGSIYRAEHLSLGKTVVIKVLHEHLSGDPSLSKRFHREARAASRLKHPNAINIIDFGSTGENVHYIAMDFVDGQDLAHLIHKEFPLAPTRILNILDQIASALDEAHAQGIIHRDLKPENIMIEDRRHQKDFATVLDFGIAKIKDPDRENPETFATVAGIVCGTPEYMSPEQAKGESLDARTDLYSLGVILYQMNTNRLPFTADTPIGVVTKHLTESPPAPRTIIPDIHPAMERLILLMMSKDRHQRPSSALEVKRLIEGVVRTIEDDPQGLSQTAPMTRPASGSDGEQSITTSRTTPVPPAGAYDDEPTLADDSESKSSRGKLVAIIGLIALLAVTGVFLVPRLLPKSGPDSTRDVTVESPEDALRVSASSGDASSSEPEDIKVAEQDVVADNGSREVNDAKPETVEVPRLDPRVVDSLRSVIGLYQDNYRRKTEQLASRQKAWSELDPSKAEAFTPVLATYKAGLQRLEDLGRDLDVEAQQGTVSDDFLRKVDEEKNLLQENSRKADALLAEALPAPKDGRPGVEEQIAQLSTLITERQEALNAQGSALQKKSADWNQAKNPQKGREVAQLAQQVEELSRELGLLTQGLNAENVVARRDGFNQVLGKADSVLSQANDALAEVIVVKPEMTEAQKKAQEQRRLEMQKRKAEEEKKRQEEARKKAEEEARKKAEEDQKAGQADAAAKAKVAEANGDQANGTGRYAEAIMYYKEALRLRPSAPLHKKLGKAYNSKGDYANGAKHLRTYLKLMAGKLSDAEVKLIEGQIRE